MHARFSCCSWLHQGTLYNKRVVYMNMCVCVVRGDCVCGVYLLVWIAAAACSKQVCSVCWLIKKSRAARFPTLQTKFNSLAVMRCKYLHGEWEVNIMFVPKKKFAWGQTISYHRQFCAKNSADAMFERRNRRDPNIEILLHFCRRASLCDVRAENPIKGGAHCERRRRCCIAKIIYAWPFLVV